jgi:hypothetical protein
MIRLLCSICVLVSRAQPRFSLNLDFSIQIHDNATFGNIIYVASVDQASEDAAPEHIKLCTRLSQPAGISAIPGMLVLIMRPVQSFCLHGCSSVSIFHSTLVEDDRNVLEQPTRSCVGIRAKRGNLTCHVVGDGN